MTSKLKVGLVVAALAFPAGVYAGALRGHPNLEKARNSLSDADRYINASEKANEGVWKDEGGHGQKAKQLIHDAKGELDAAAEWVNNHH